MADINTWHRQLGHASNQCIFDLATKQLAQGMLIVFEGSVQPGFLPPKRATVDRNQSGTDPNIEVTKSNHLGPVFCGPWHQFRLIQTGFFA